MQKKLLVFDCDGVLTYEKSSWRILHEYFGSMDNTYFANLYRRGFISYLDWMKIDIALMIHSMGRPISREDVERALAGIRIRQSAYKTVKEIIARGHIPAIVSSGIDLVVRKICKELGVELCYYNELLYIDNELVPGGVVNVPLKEKIEIIKNIAEKVSIRFKDIIYIGDDEWDIDIFKHVPVSIAIEPCGEACSYATYVVKDLEDILNLNIL